MAASYDVIIIGAGAAGLMCGAAAGARGRRVLMIDSADKPGEKIRISGGGRCNFTNIYCGPDNFISQNPHFCKSALGRYSAQDFIDLVNSYGIAWHEKTKGQLFCDGRSQEIIDMLLSECDKGGCDLWLGTQVLDVKKGTDGTGGEERFTVVLEHQSVTADAVVIATGGPSIPKMGASRFGYEIAERFGLDIVDTVPALVPLTFTDSLKDTLKSLSGVSVDTTISHAKAVFDEAMLFTHRGLSGPAVLQISSYWEPGDSITINMAPGTDLTARLKEDRLARPRISPANWLAQFIPARIADSIAAQEKAQRLADLSDKAILNLSLMASEWRVKPAGSEGYRTAEVTKGGVNTDALSSKTMETRSVPGLYFIGEVVDVTGHLGGHNFQWAWASGVACGEVC
ncbi:NAD(P)/FAD-dependent oxidoreductase [Fretibacter rubidus]|uniref:NAD(P)/FAD-dependent oxidoreductase n=1 Tax=Fretibacter rubidus TaxID=570162 RepID=UPI00352A9B6D